MSALLRGMGLGVVGFGVIVAGAIGCSSSSSKASSGAADGGSPANTDGSFSPNDASRPTGSGDDAGSTGSGDDESALDAGVDTGVNGPHGAMRVIDYAFPTPLRFDVCVSTDALGASANWIGPLMAGTHRPLTFGTRSPYLDVPANTRSIRFVLADSTDCGVTLDGVPDFALTTPLAENSRSSVMLLGTASFSDAGGTQPLQIKQLTDLVEPADGGNMLRVVNVCENIGAIDIVAYTGFFNQDKDPCTKLYDNVGFGDVGVATSLPGDGGPTGASGYAPLRGEDLFDFAFNVIGFVPHGGSCTDAFLTTYSTDGVLMQGAWTFFVTNNNAIAFCRDDGTIDPYCDPN